VFAYVGLKALTNLAPLAVFASSCDAELSGGVTSPSKLSLTGFVISMTTFHARPSPYCSTAVVASR
jgi:hypothetical protein